MSAFCLGMRQSVRMPTGSQSLMKPAKPLEQRLSTSDSTTKRSVQEIAASENPDRPRVFLDLAVGIKPLGRVVCELFSDVVPRTAENFRSLCTGERGNGDSGHLLHYKGCPFHRVVPGKAVQGGDIVRGNGKGGDSIYGLTFEDESFDLSHSSEGLLTMVNQGRANTCSSQFMVLLRPDTSLDRRNVVFGRVVAGLDVIRRVEAVCAVSDVRGKCNGAIAGAGVVAFTKQETAVIADCGQLEPGAEGAGAAGAEAAQPAEKRRKIGGGGGVAAVSAEPVHLFHVLKKHAACKRPDTWRGGTATCTKGKARLAVENLRKRLAAVPAAEAAFREAARDHSDDSSAQRGGDLGMVEPGELAKEVESVGFGLSPGELSEVFETPHGVHLLLRAP